MIRIPIKNGDIDAAIDKLKVAKKAQDKAFNERLANFLTSPNEQQPTGQRQHQQPSNEPQQQPQRSPAPSYQSILARSRRMG